MDNRIEVVHTLIGHGNIKPIKVGDGLYRAYCPFCKDDIPSLFISTTLQEYHCFNCKRSGNVTNFVMEYYNTDFFGAVKILSGKEADSEKYREDLKMYYDMNKEAAIYFNDNLYIAKEGLEYWHERGISDDVIRRFGLGYIGSGGLYVHLKDKGFSPIDILDNSLARKNNKKYHDFFYKRVMIPIISANGKIIGFGGRVLDDSKPKYLNTGQTPVFDKRMHLFGLNLAKNSHRDGLILCEGYMDVISMHQAGFDNAVASLGTALTEEQAYLISRYTNHLYLAYDSDNAGIKATEDAYKICRQQGIFIKCIDLLDKKDPDEFIKFYGREKFAEQIKRASYFNG